MVGAGDEIAPAVGGSYHPRASYADREQVISILQAAFVQGLVGKDEFDLRVGQALASRTYAELAAVTADLPAGLTVAQPPGPARTRKKFTDPFTRAVGTTTLLYAGVWAYALLLSPHRGDNPVAGHLIVIGLFLWLLVIIFAAMAERVPSCADPPGNSSDPVGREPPKPLKTIRDAARSVDWEPPSTA
jgi:Domain of unknown function (DUF1707)